MRTTDVFGMCVKNLWKRKLRTFLTLLGVVIGTGSIVVMISLGLATDAQFAQMIEDVGLDMTAIDVFIPWEMRRWNMDGTMESDIELTDETADRIARLPGVSVATPMMESQLLFRTGPYAMRMWDVIGMRPEALVAMGFETEYGRLLEPEDEFGALFSSRTEREFFTTIITNHMMQGFWSDRYWEERMGLEVETLVDVMNDPIRVYYDTNSLWRHQVTEDDDFGGVEMDAAFEVVRSFPLEVVGVLTHNEASGMFGGFRNTSVFMNIETLQQLNLMAYQTQRRNQADNEWQIVMTQSGPRETYDRIFVRAESIADTRNVAEEIEEMGYGVNFQGDWIDQQRQSQQGIQALLAAIAAVSLAVAAINIANTMITSVTERTREIGVMKVIGASVPDVLKIFLLEAAIIGLLGGIFGVGLALGMSYGMNNFEMEFLHNLNMGVPDWLREEGAARPTLSLVTPWLCALALAVASGIGILSGMYPAWRATRLSALAAIRGD